MAKLKAPGPGRWRRDEGRLTGAITPYLADLLVEPMQRGLAEGWERYGVPLERMDLGFVAGRLYARPRPVGAPEEPRGRPPRFVLKLMFLVHPELRRRKARAQEVFSRRLWREDAARWREEIAPAFRQRNLELQTVEPDALGDAELARHLRGLNRLFREAIHRHFVHAPAHHLPVGDFLVHAAEWTSQPVSACTAALRGSSPASDETLELIDRVAEAIAPDEAARADLTSDDDAAERLRRLRERDGEVGRALDDYLREHGDRIVTGYDISDRRLVELPDVVLGAIHARMGRADDSADDEAGDPIRERVPHRHRAEYDDLLAEARSVLGIRDHDVGVGWLWRKGLTRRAMLAAGRRLHERGALRDREHVFETRPDELLAMIHGRGPSADELTQRADERKRLHLVEPPLHLGDAEEPPPADHFPPAIARMQRAVTCYIAHFDRDAAPLADIADGLSGHPVSGGCYEGRARIVLRSEDFSRIAEGDVLVARTTSPAYNVLLPLLGAVITDRGGCLSHAAIVAREYGIPGVVGCGDATAKIPDGSIVRVDGDAGTVHVIGGGTALEDAPAHVTGDRLRPAEPHRGGTCVALCEATDVARFGGKSASLARNLRRGLPVPDGFAIDVAMTESVAATDPGALELLKGVLGDLEHPVAVRSSAVGEDSASASFAGQHLTVLGVRSFDEIASAIERVWGSGRTESALAYRKRMGIEGEPQVAVTIQRLVDPICAGVLFTRDPVSGEDLRIVEATWGFGEAVVAGLVTPDHFRISPDGPILERRAGEKDIAIRRHPAGGTHEVPVTGADVTRLCLDDDQLTALCSLATRCEEVFGAPQDIEWAFAGDELFLLQSRAVTT